MSRVDVLSARVGKLGDELLSGEGDQYGVPEIAE